MQHPCRYCLDCSSVRGATKMVKRVPVVLVNRRAEKAEELRAREQKERAEREEAERVSLQVNAPDYVVEPAHSIGQPTTDRFWTSDLKDALRRACRMRADGVEPSLRRVQFGKSSEAVWHGRKFAGWLRDDGKREASPSGILGS